MKKKLHWINKAQGQVAEALGFRYEINFIIAQSDWCNLNIYFTKSLPLRLCGYSVQEALKTCEYHHQCILDEINKVINSPVIEDLYMNSLELYSEALIVREQNEKGKQVVPHIDTVNDMEQALSNFQSFIDYKS